MQPRLHDLDRRALRLQVRDEPAYPGLVQSGDEERGGRRFETRSRCRGCQAPSRRLHFGQSRTERRQLIPDTGVRRRLLRTSEPLLDIVKAPDDAPICGIQLAHPLPELRGGGLLGVDRRWRRRDGRDRRRVRRRRRLSKRSPARRIRTIGFERSGATRPAARPPLLVLPVHLGDCRIVVDLDGAGRLEAQHRAFAKRVDVGALEGMGVCLEQGEHHALRTCRWVRTHPLCYPPQGVGLADRTVALRCAGGGRGMQQGEGREQESESVNHNRVLEGGGCAHRSIVSKTKPDQVEPRSAANFKPCGRARPPG